MKKIVLASASPRRRELLSQVGVAFEVKPASGEERITSAEPAKVVEELSRQKAMFTAYALEEEENRDLRDVVVIGADTVVSYEGKILGKPADETAAIEMLAMLQGNTHQEYVNSKDPMDKAGSYGIQGAWGAYVKGIRGDYNNVVGLPVARLIYETKKLGMNLRG